MATARPIGDLLREWRRRRRLSQLDLACAADISTRHLSFLETGRSSPSRNMLLHLAERLDVPLRERNALLLAAGFAPAYRQRALDDPALAASRKAIDLVLQGHEPYPALAVDRHWTLVAANAALGRLLAGISPVLLQPPVNVLRVSLHPEGLASRIVNLAQWRAHILARLRHQVELTADATLEALLGELRSYGHPAGGERTAGDDGSIGGVVVALQLRTEDGDLSFISTTTVFATPADVTLSELAIESFYPADAATGDTLRRLAGAR